MDQAGRRMPPLRLIGFLRPEKTIMAEIHATGFPAAERHGFSDDGTNIFASLL
jgi:hypothetical protein